MKSRNPDRRTKSDLRLLCMSSCWVVLQGFKAKKGATKLEKEDLESAQAVLDKLEAGIEIRSVDNWSVKEVDFINRTQFITAKPVVYLVNMSEKDFCRKKNKHLSKVMQYVKENGGDPVIPYSAAFEERIYDLNPEDKEKVCFVQLLRIDCCCVVRNNNLSVKTDEKWSRHNAPREKGKEVLLLVPCLYARFQTAEIIAVDGRSCSENTRYSTLR